MKKTNSNKIKDSGLVESVDDKEGSSGDKEASDSAGIDDSIDMSIAASEDVSEDPGNNSPPQSPIKRSPSAPLVRSELLRVVVRHFCLLFCWC